MRIEDDYQSIETIGKTTGKTRRTTGSLPVNRDYRDSVGGLYGRLPGLLSHTDYREDYRDYWLTSSQ